MSRKRDEQLIRQTLQLAATTVRKLVTDVDAGDPYTEGVRDAAQLLESLAVYVDRDGRSTTINVGLSQ